MEIDLSIQKSLVDKNLGSITYNPSILINGNSKDIKSRIKQLLKKSNRVDIAVSYCVWSGLVLIYDDLKKLGVVLKRARYFITCNGKYYDHVKYFKESFISGNLLALEKRNYSLPINAIQMSLFDLLPPSKEDKVKCLTGNI